MDLNRCSTPPLIHFSTLRACRSSTLMICMSLLVGSQWFSAGATELRAGLGKIDLTPSQPVKMGGYESRKDPSQGVHDPLGARALVLEKDGEHLALVSIDNLGFYNDT